MLMSSPCACSKGAASEPAFMHGSSLLFCVWGSSTAAFKSINQPLRDLVAGYCVDPHPFPVTVAFISEGIKRLRAINQNRSIESSTPLQVPSTPRGSAQNGRRASNRENALDLWRGLKGIEIIGNEDFFAQGGTEAAPLSTTRALAVALMYAASASSSCVLMRLRTTAFIQRGAGLSYLSAFPQEQEILFPPLTYLQAAGHPLNVNVNLEEGVQVSFTVLTVEPHIGT